MDDKTDYNEKDTTKSYKKLKKGRKGKNYKSAHFTRYFLNIGKKNNLNVRKLIGLINELTDSNDIEIGKIDIQRNFSFFDIEKKSQKRIERAFLNAKYNSIKLKIEKAQKRK